MKELIGKLIRIEWRNPDHDWEFYILLGFKHPMLHLKGAYDPILKAKHQGDDFYAHIDEAALIQGYTPWPT